MNVIINNGGRREDWTEDYDCVLRTLSTLTGISYEELSTHYGKSQGRVAGEPTRFIPKGEHQDFTSLGFQFKLVKPAGRNPHPKIRDLSLDRDKNYLVDFHFADSDIGHVAAVVGNTLWDNEESDGIEDAEVGGIWEVSRIARDPGLQAAGTGREVRMILNRGPYAPKKAE